MKVGIPRESASGERRVAIIPAVARKLRARGPDLLVQTGAGAGADWPDEAYREVGCEIVESRTDLFGRADVILQVRGLGANSAEVAIDPYREGQTVIGLLGPYAIEEDTFRMLADRRISAFALELIPRTGRAQSMDALTSMASLGGYKAAVMAADALPALFPMQMTAAGTVRPADVFVVGAGVAGLQAIATAKRLGARVRAYDIRPAVREEVESLGAEFLALDLDPVDAAGASGYAREQDSSFYERQRKLMTRAVADADVVITAAAVPGRTAPRLVSDAMVEEMAAGSVVVDLAADGGGNCDRTRPGDTVEHAGVTIYGPTNLPSTVSHTASQLFANNLRTFLEQLLEDGRLDIDTADDIVDATLLTHDGTVRFPGEEAANAGTQPRGES